MPELIDKDYIKNMLLAWGKELSENPNAESDIQIDMIRQFYNSVSDFPTIDAEPVRHGRWIKSDVYIFKKCSECGSIWDAALCENIFFIYCPRCGSKNGGADKDAGTD